jgi:hypothetical protein
MGQPKNAKRSMERRNTRIDQLINKGNYSVDRIFINHREHRVHRGEF